MPYSDRENAVSNVNKINEDFENAHASLFPDVNIRLRSGIYFLEPDCTSAAAAIDAANCARRRISDTSALSACMFDKRFHQEQAEENEIINTMGSAMRNGKISELDFYVFEQVAAFLAKNNELGRKQVPISINASILHASDSNTVKHYLDILRKAGCEEAQGYWFSKPMPVEEYEKMMYETE